MRFTVSSEQLKYFRTNGYLELEELITEEEAFSLIKAIREIHVKSPGYPEEHLYRSIPQIASLARKKGWGQIATELLNKKPLRLEFDKFFTSTPQFSLTLDEESVGMLLNLESKKALFFKGAHPPESLYNSNKNCYFLLVITAKFLPEKLNPVVAQ